MSGTDSVLGGSINFLIYFGLNKLLVYMMKYSSVINRFLELLSGTNSILAGNINFLIYFGLNKLLIYMMKYSSVVNINPLILFKYMRFYL